MSNILQMAVISKGLITKQLITQELFSKIPTAYFTNESFKILHAGIIKVGTDKQTLADHTGIDLEEINIIIDTAVSNLLTSTGLKDSIAELHRSIQDAPRSKFVCASEILLQTVEPRKLIGKVIERGCTGQLFGPSGDGKTFLALDLLLAVGTGGIWNGNQCEQGIVLYFAGEGHTGLKRRIKAWHRHHGEPDLSSVHLSRSVISFDVAGMRRVVSEVKALESATDKQVALIVVDTLARHLQGDENSTRDMSEFVRAVDGLRDAFPESTAIIIHHTGNDAEKQGRSRGSSALKAAVEYEMQCLKGFLTFIKNKDGALPPPIEFKLVPVQIGTDKDGEPITSCIVQYGERSEMNREVCMTATERQLLELVNSHPDILSGDLRSVFYDKRRERIPDVKTNTLKNAFLRAFQGLIVKGKIQEINNVVVLPNDTSSQSHKPSQNDGMTGGVTASQPSYPYGVV